MLETCDLWLDIDEQIDVLYWTANRSEYPSDWNTDIFCLLSLVDEYNGNY